MPSCDAWLQVKLCAMRCLQYRPGLCVSLDSNFGLGLGFDLDLNLGLVLNLILDVIVDVILDLEINLVFCSTLGLPLAPGLGLTWKFPLTLGLFLLKLYIFFMRCLFACWCVETPLSRYVHSRTDRCPMSLVFWSMSQVLRCCILENKIGLIKKYPKHAHRNEYNDKIMIRNYSKFMTIF